MPVGLSDGTSYNDSADWFADSIDRRTDKQRSDQMEINTNSTVGDFQSRFYATDTSTMPPQASTELAGALKSYGSTKVPGNSEKVKRDASQDIYVNPWVTITPEDIDKGIDMALSFSGGGLHTVNETIKSAAIRLEGEIFEAPNHGMALGQWMEKYPEKPFPNDAKMWEKAQGFTTTKDRFISREEAFNMAKKQDLIKDNVLPALTTDSKVLLSEDLKGNPGFRIDINPRKGGKPWTDPGEPIPFNPD